MRRALLMLAGVLFVPAHVVAQNTCPQDVDYTLAANLKITDTPMGAGDGTYPVGPGKITLRVQNNDVRLMKYEMPTRFSIHASVLFWKADVTTDAVTTAGGGCEGVARGRLENGKIVWQTPVRGMRTDGTITCTGNLCGNFGAPPPGKSELHVPPADRSFAAFEMNGPTFSMYGAPPIKLEKPKQTSQIFFSSREIRRACTTCT